MRRSSEYSTQKSSKRRRSSSGEKELKERNKLQKHSTSTVIEPPETEFSFLDYKRDINKIFTYSNDTNTVTNNLDDFWVFVKKYESTLRKAGKPVLGNEDSSVAKNDLGVPLVFSKFHCINFNTNIKFMDNACDDRVRKKLNKKIFDSILNVVSVYLDFKNKEKLEKLKKLRQNQRDLPVASYRSFLYFYS